MKRILRIIVLVIIVSLYTTFVSWLVLQNKETILQSFGVEMFNVKYFVTTVDDIHYIDEDNYVVYIKGDNCKIILFYYQDELSGAINFEEKK